MTSEGTPSQAGELKSLTEKTPWSKDKSTHYYQGPKYYLYYPAAKLTLLIATFMMLNTVLSTKISLVVCLAILLLYQRVIAMCMGLIAIPIMDQACFVSPSKSIINIMNCTCYAQKVDEDIVKWNMNRGFEMMPKYTYKIVEVAGDYYYKKMSIEETWEKCLVVNKDGMLKNQDDINRYIQENINVKMPLDGPLWRVYQQQEFTDVDGKKKCIMIFKFHHSFCDGVSLMSSTLAISSEYNRDFFVKFTEPSWWQVLAVRLMVPLQIPGLIMSLLQRAPQNFMTRQKSQICGKVTCSSSKELDFPKVKELSKKLNVTINDLVTCSISNALNTLFEENGDKNIDKVVVGIPANIRFSFYPTPEQVKLENKFACIPLMLPIVKNMKDSYKTIAKATKSLKNIPQIYATYVLARLGSRIMPKLMTRQLLKDTTYNFTLGFSNTPGPIKPIYYYNTKKEKIFTEWSQFYMVVAGYMGCAVSAMSFCNSFRVCITSDNGYLTPAQNKRLCQLIEQSIFDEMDRCKNLEVDEPKKDK